MHEHSVDDREDRGVRADPQRERDHDDGGRKRAPAERAESVPEILDDFAHGVRPVPNRRSGAGLLGDRDERKAGCTRMTRESKVRAGEACSYDAA